MYSQVSYKYSMSINLIISIIFLQYIAKNKITFINMISQLIYSHL